MPVLVAPEGGVVVVSTPEWDVSCESPNYSVEFSTGVVEAFPPYVGPYDVVPSDVPQTLPTEGRDMERNITVGPIPNNYGLITYNGTSIRVS